MPPIFELEWNPSIVATIGTNDFSHYRGVASNQGLIRTISMEWGPQCEAIVERVAIKRGSTVIGFSTEGMWNKS